MTLSGTHSSGPRALNPWLVVLALAPGVFLTLADATVMSVAVPLIIRRLEGSVISVSWVMNGYNLVLTVLFLTMGRLADRYGHKLLFVLGLALFTAASVGCALAPGASTTLIAWRVLQAVGAAAVVPTALALLLQAFPDERQGFAAGLFGALSSAAAAAGPVLGGLLIQRWGWPAVFWFNVPVGALGVVLALGLVRTRGVRTREPLDWPGVGLVTAGLFCLTLGIIQGNDWGWTSGAILGLFAAAAAILAVWVWWELRSASPLFDLRLFGRRTFAAASAAIMTVDTALMGTMFMLVIFMIAMMDYTELKAGLAIAVVPAAVLVLTPLAGWLTDRIGPRVPAVAGALVAAAGLFALGLPPPQRPTRLGALAQRARRRRHRPLPAGAARRRDERRARRRQGRRLRHAQHGAPARLPARRGHPRRRVRAHHARRGQQRRRQGPGAGPLRPGAQRPRARQARRWRSTRRAPSTPRPAWASCAGSPTRSPRTSGRTSASSRASPCSSSRTRSRTCSGTRSPRPSTGRSSPPPSPRAWAPWPAPCCRGASPRKSGRASHPAQRRGTLTRHIVVQREQRRSPALADRGAFFVGGSRRREAVRHTALRATASVTGASPTSHGYGPQRKMT